MLSTEKLSKPHVLTCLTTEHLLGQLGHGQCTILLRTTGSQWCKASHEEVQTWEWHKVHCNLAQVAVQLSWETQAAADTKWFRSPYVGVVSFKVRKQISYNASLSSRKDSSEFSTN